MTDSRHLTSTSDRSFECMRPLNLHNAPLSLQQDCSVANNHAHDDGQVMLHQLQ